MGGIVGIKSKGDLKEVEKMLGRVSYRGPDAKECTHANGWALGHARLSVLDKTRGSQPMSDPVHKSHIVHSGEIYNFRELRKELGGKFKTDTDAEVILRLHAGGQDPEEWLPKLDGMYAFAIVDKDGILLARDPQGVQPLYLGLTGQQIVFGSEIKAVMPYADKIMEFPPGFVYTTKGGGRPFRRVTEQKVESTDPEEIAQELLSRITNAVASRMVSDVPVGVLLSGGLGSSIIASIANQFSPNIKTFAVGMEGSPDLEAARKIAEHIGTDHHERIFTFEEALKILPKVIYHLESYDATIVRSAIANYFGAELAAEHVKVALSGEGADELFAGYPYLTGVHGKRLADELDEIARALHFTSLQRCDRMCTAHGLEVRVPYLDDLQVAEYAMAIPVQFKVEPRRNIDKWILRKSVEGLLPDETVWRKKERTTNGTGIGKMLSDWAESQIGEDLYKRVAERHKAFGIRNREELAYFLMFRRKFPAEKVWPLIGRSRRV